MGWLGPLGWLGPNLKTTFKPQIYQFFLYLVVKDLKENSRFPFYKKANLIQHINQKYCLFLLKSDHFRYAAISSARKQELLKPD